MRFHRSSPRRAPEAAYPDAAIPTDLDEYLFDLNGFLFIPALLSADEVAEGNALIDAIPDDCRAAAGTAGCSARTIPSIAARATSRFSSWAASSSG